MKYIKKIIKSFDMFGQTINFSYKNEKYFSTKLGLIISILIYIVVILYFIANILITVSRKFPSIVENIETKSENDSDLPSFQIINDFPGLFSINSDYVSMTDEESFNKTQSQMSFGFFDEDKDEYSPIDPSYFYINSYQKQGKEFDKHLFFDTCKRFPNKMEEFSAYSLNRTYCLYSEYNLRGDVLNPQTNSNNMMFEINKCKNDSLYSLPKIFHPDYIYLYLKYLNIQEGRNLCDSREKCWKEFSLSHPNSCINIIKTVNDVNKTNSNNIQNRSLYEKKENNNKRSEEEVLNEKSKEFYNLIDETYSKAKRILFEEAYPEIDQTFINIENIVFSLSEAHCYIDEYNLLLSHINKKIDLEVIEEIDLSKFSPGPKTANPLLKYTPLLRYLLNSHRLLTENNKIKLIKCKSNEEISTKIKNLQLNVIVFDRRINETSDLFPISEYIRKDVFNSNSFSTNIFYMFSKIEVSTFKNIIPKFVLNLVKPLYSLQVKDIQMTYDNYNPDSIFKVSFSLNNDIIIFERTYSNILDIAGLVGGLAAVLIAIGYYIIISYLDLRYNESIINEFYQVISPENNDKVNNSFEIFIDDLYKKYKSIPHNEHSYSKKVKSPGNALETYFSADEVLKIKSFQEKLIEFEDAKKKYLEQKKKEEKDEILDVKKNQMIKVNKDEAYVKNVIINSQEGDNDNIKFEELSYEFDVDSSRSDGEEGEHNSVVIEQGKGQVNEKANEKKKRHSQLIPQQDKIKRSSKLNIYIGKDYENKLDDSNICLDESEMTMREYLKYKIIYEVFKNQIYSGMRFTEWEAFFYIFCKCFSKCTKAAHRKFVTYEKAVKLIKKDTDYCSLIKSIQDYDLIKKSLLNKDQFSLFQSFTKEAINLNKKEKDCQNENNSQTKLESERIEKEKSSSSKKFKEDSNKKEKLQMGIHNLNEALSNIASSDTEDDPINMKLLLQLKIKDGLIDMFINEINHSKIKKRKKESINKDETGQYDIHKNSILDEKVVKQLSKIFPGKY